MYWIKRQMPEMSETERNRYFSRLKRGTKLEKNLCFISAVSLLTITFMVALLVYFGYHYNNNLGLKKTNQSNVCITPGCVKAASVVLSNIDETIDPCNDFYRFACGQWLKTNTIPEDKSFLSIDEEIYDRLKLRLKELLEAELDGTEPRFIRILKDVYDACMDEKRIENAGAKPLKKLLKSLGGWPVVEGKKWNENKFDWIETMISLPELGPLLSCYVDADARNSSRNIIYLGGVLLGMPDPEYLIEGVNETETAAYFKKMVKAANLLGADIKLAEEELLEVLQFEITLANYTLLKEGTRNISQQYNKYSIKQLQKMIPQVPWLKYFNSILQNEVNENEMVILLFPEYVKNLVGLIERTEKRVVANYICWMIVHGATSYLSKEWRDIDLEYTAAMGGASRECNRWEKCIPTRDLNMALSSLYVRHHFQHKTKYEVTKIVKYVHNELLHILKDIDWMDEKTKAHARAKANNMLFFIAYPDEILNNTAVMKYYENLYVSKETYFENFCRVKKWAQDKQFSNLRKPNDRKDWLKYADAAVVNAFNLPEDNSIILPAGYLASPFYDKDQPNYMNFAIIGFFAGHEITHGFDDIGRQFDKDGNNINWWESKTEESFKRKAQCLIDLFSNYTAENGMEVNGENTLGENIADFAGLKEAYLAYQAWVKDNGPEQLLPGVKYNQNQLFWISYAFGFCTKQTLGALKEEILSDSHSPGEFRVIGPISNLNEFARDFNCPHGSPMNRKHKCEIW